MQEWRNWTGDEVSRPVRTLCPRDAGEVAAAVRDAARDGLPVRMAGTGHSFTGAAVTDGVLLRPDRLTGIVALTGDSVTVRAGTRLRELDATVRRRGWRVSFPVEVRVAAADDRWLSTAYGRETAYLAAHRYVREPHRDYLAAVADAVRDVAGEDARPHWGKLHDLTAADLAPRYPRFAEAVALRDRLDPEGRFANPYTSRVLGPVGR